MAETSRPFILALDTSEAYCSAALLGEAGQQVFRQEKIGKGHAERLIPLVEELFAEAGCDYAAIAKVAVSTGPGTFTGLRIGLSVARGISLALGVPCVGLSSLSVLACQKSYGGLIHSVMLGRGGQVFYQAFEGRDERGLPVPVADAANIDAEVAARYIEEQSGFVIGSGVLAVMGREPTALDAVNPVTLATLGRQQDPKAFPPEPFYLRAADAVKATPIFSSKASVGN